MTQTRVRTVAPILSLLLATLSCGPFLNPTKPTQVVDLPPMVGKSLEEMTTMFGPLRERGICWHWDLPEGELSVCYKDRDGAKKRMSSISYSFPPAPFFSPRIAVGSPEEMAALVNIDLQGRKPDTEIRGAYIYDDFILNGKAVEDVAFDGGPKTIVGVRVHIAPSATSDSLTNTNTSASTAGVTMANFNRLQTGMTYAQVVQILGKEGEQSGVLGSGSEKVVMYKWAPDGDSSGARLDTFFKNGKLDRKLQFSLK